MVSNLRERANLALCTFLQTLNKMLYRSPWKISIHTVHASHTVVLSLQKPFLEIQNSVIIQVDMYYWWLSFMGFQVHFKGQTSNFNRLCVGFWQLISTECTPAPGKQICYIYHYVFGLGAGIVLCPHSFHSPSSNYWHWSTSASTGEHCRWALQIWVTAWTGAQDLCLMAAG